jgi:hypothetical protein
MIYRGSWQDNVEIPQKKAKAALLDKFSASLEYLRRYSTI